MSNLSLDPAPWTGGSKGNADAFGRTVRHGGFFAVSVRPLNLVARALTH
jgi:hypothetical protein